jgi:hypothetical protein
MPDQPASFYTSSELWDSFFQHCCTLHERSCEMREAVAASKARILKSRALLAKLENRYPAHWK